MDQKRTSQIQAKLLQDPKAEILALEAIFREVSESTETVEVLEAGCGRRWPFNLNDLALNVTGVDQDAVALKVRQTEKNDIDQAIVGDLMEVDLPKNHYDVIFSSFVLEHVLDAERVLSRFVECINENGVIIIRVPDPQSAFGFVAHYTPHWVHIWYYKYILKTKDAGKPGKCPYPTHYSQVISQEGMHQFCIDNPQVKLLKVYAHGYGNRGKGKFVYLVESIKRTLFFMSLGKLSYKHTNLTYILSKR